MSNKKKGNNFEKDIARILYERGFWVRVDKSYAQTCDIIAAKNNSIYLLECKTCKNDYFDINRIESNQEDSRKLFRETGNKNAWVVYLVGDDDIYFSKEFIKKPSEGIKLEEWLINENIK